MRCFALAFVAGVVGAVLIVMVSRRRERMPVVTVRYQLGGQGLFGEAFEVWSCN